MQTGWPASPSHPTASAHSHLFSHTLVFPKIKFSWLVSRHPADPFKVDEQLEPLSHPGGKSRGVPGVAVTSTGQVRCQGPERGPVLAQVCAHKLLAPSHLCWAKPSSTPTAPTPQHLPVPAMETFLPQGEMKGKGYKLFWGDFNWSQDKKFSQWQQSVIWIISSEKWQTLQNWMCLGLGWAGRWEYCLDHVFAKKGWTRWSWGPLQLLLSDSYSTQALQRVHEASLWDASWRLIAFPFFLFSTEAWEKRCY